MDDLNLILFANLFLVPSILFYYFRTKRKVQVPLVVALILFCIRDFLILESFTRYANLWFGCFMLGLLILIYYGVTEFRRTKVDVAEMLSFFIIYGFSFFLFYTLAEMVPEALPQHVELTYAYLFLLVVFLSLCFTVYFLKAHKASLWLMLSASAVTFSESSLFLKTFVIKDLSVAFFYPFFHVFFYFAVIKYAISRRDRISSAERTIS